MVAQRLRHLSIRCFNPHKPVKNQDRYKTILVIVIGLSVIAYIFKIPMLTNIALAIGAVSLVFGFIAKWIEWAWLKLALGLGWVNSRILLTIIYFIFLFPIALISRLFTKDPLKLKVTDRDSLYETRDHTYTKDDLENIW